VIIIINGPCGVGKTETAWHLVAKFERGVMLDGDYIGAVHPFEIYDEARIEYLYQTMRHLIIFHQQHSYTNFVINYVFETPASLARLRHLLADVDDVIYAFRLTCAEPEIERRICARNTDQTQWELARFRELVAIQTAQAWRGDMGFVIDTTTFSVAQVAEAIWQNICESIELVPYDSTWPAQFAMERLRIDAALGDWAVDIQHIGSTAVPALAAKPVIDILVTVRCLADFSECIAPLAALGYTFIDYPQNTDRRFFRKGVPRTHHLHIVQDNSPTMLEHVAFRDALRANADLRQQYAALKADLAARYKTDRATYSASKTEFIQRVLKQVNA
jgi:GrpB-like predicted nucleotidyltransferase (UPF0157 family)